MSQENRAPFEFFSTRNLARLQTVNQDIVFLCYKLLVPALTFTFFSQLLETSPGDSQTTTMRFLIALAFVALAAVRACFTLFLFVCVPVEKFLEQSNHSRGLSTVPVHEQSNSILSSYLVWLEIAEELIFLLGIIFFIMKLLIVRISFHLHCIYGIPYFPLDLFHFYSTSYCENQFSCSWYIWQTILSSQLVPLLIVKIGFLVCGIYGIPQSPLNLFQQYQHYTSTLYQNKCSTSVPSCPELKETLSSYLSLVTGYRPLH